ncbi:MAG: aminotransferase class V-fold PLP-dependent enzyme [Candidatus Woesearchaeota archaeon]
MKEIYLDHAATTPIDEEVKREMDVYLTGEYGNPGSFNSVGLRAKEAVDSSRARIAKVLNASPDEIIFTATGTESINLAILGLAKSMKGKHIITTRIEHHAVLDTCEHLESEGYEVTYLDVDRYGVPDLNLLKKAIRKDTMLITMMYANNEIGTILPIKEISKIAKSNNILFHTDACQAGCSQDLDVKSLGVDMMTLNGSKIYGPKGIGILYRRKGISLKPIVYGGGQEFGLRSGTENVPGIVGFAKALELVQKDKDRENKRLIKLRDRLIKGLLKIPDTILNGHPKERLPNNVNITFLNIEGEAMMMYLNEEGVCASSGSACTSKSLDPSHVILATGMPYEAAHGSLRFTLGHSNTEEDIDKVISIMPEIVKKLRLLSPVKLKMEDIMGGLKR